MSIKNEIMEEFRAFCNEITCEDICDGVYFSFVKNINGKMIELRTKSTDDYICKMFEDMKKDITKQMEKFKILDADQ